jgi:hypothetical protein
MAQRLKETQYYTTAGAICGGHVMPSARLATKLPQAKLTARIEGSQSEPKTT